MISRSASTGESTGPAAGAGAGLVAAGPVVVHATGPVVGWLIAGSVAGVGAAAYSWAGRVEAA